MKKSYFNLFMVCAISFLFISGAYAQQTHLEIPITSGGDDGEEATAASEWGNLGWISLGSSDLELIWDDDPQYVATFFRDLFIPQGATIDSAYIQFVAKTDSDDDIEIVIFGDSSVDPAELTDTDKDFSSRDRTTATVTWTPDPWLAEYDALPAQRTPNLSPIISEIVSKDGWKSGNNLLLMLTGEDQEKTRNAYSYDSDEGTPVLHVYFTATETASKIIGSNESEFVTYPNPTEGIIYIKNPSSDQFSYKIFNITGKLIDSKQNITDSSAEVNLSNQTKGLYFVNIISGGKAESFKITLK